jgi:signal transduction histidine kinase
MQLIEQVLELKQLEYKNTQVKFNFEVTSGSSSCYIHANVTSLMRMLSNLINNAVEALDNKLGIITIKLESNINAVNIIVEDNGKGMTAEVKNKILNNIAITHGKANGHGIGLTQVREALVQANGKLAISSEPGMGTKVSLTFPRLNVAA